MLSLRDSLTDPVHILSRRLDFDRYKATVKGLTQFGDRRQGTDRNASAVDWIEAQLKSYGCTNTERIRYTYTPPSADSLRRAAAARAATGGGGRGGAGVAAQGGGRLRGVVGRTGVNVDSLAQTNLALRALNSQPTTPGIREEVFCTKVGSVHPDEMYIVGGHMDGHG